MTKQFVRCLKDVAFGYCSNPERETSSKDIATTETGIAYVQSKPCSKEKKTCGFYLDANGLRKALNIDDKNIPTPIKDAHNLFKQETKKESELVSDKPKRKRKENPQQSMF